MIDNIYLETGDKKILRIDLSDSYGFIYIESKDTSVEKLRMSSYIRQLIQSIFLKKELPKKLNDFKLNIIFDHRYTYKLSISNNQITKEQLYYDQKLLIDANRKYNLYYITHDGFEKKLDIEEVEILNSNSPNLLYDFKKYFIHINNLYNKNIIDWRSLSDRQFNKLIHLMKYCFPEINSLIKTKEGVLKVQLKINKSEMDLDQMGSGFNSLINFLPSLLISLKNDILIPKINCSEIYSLHPLLTNAINKFIKKYKIQVLLNDPISGFPLVY